MIRLRSLLALVPCALLVGPARADLESNADSARKIESRVLADTQAGELTSCVVLLDDQADLSAAYAMKDADARGWYVYDTLRQHAKRSQRELRVLLRARGIRYRSLWGANAIVVRADATLAAELAARRDVRAIESNRLIRGIKDPARVSLSIDSTTGQPRPQIGWGVANVNAPQVWALGYTGQAIVIGVSRGGRALVLLFTAAMVVWAWRPRV